MNRRLTFPVVAAGLVALALPLTGGAPAVAAADDAPATRSSATAR